MLLGVDRVRATVVDPLAEGHDEAAGEVVAADVAARQDPVLLGLVLQALVERSPVPRAAGGRVCRACR